MGLLDGKTALIFGLANERSIAWGITQAMHREGAQLQRGIGGDSARHLDHLVERDAELGGLLPRLGVRVRAGRDVRIDPDAYAAAQAGAPRRRDHGIELARGFDVEEPDTRADGLLELGRGFSHPGENDAIGRETGRVHPPQLTHGHDVGARAELLQHAQHGEIAIRLDRVADGVRNVLQRVVQCVELGADQVRAVDVRGRAHARRDRLEQRGIEA